MDVIVHLVLPAESGSTNRSSSSECAVHGFQDECWYFRRTYPRQYSSTSWRGNDIWIVYFSYFSFFKVFNVLFSWLWPKIILMCRFQNHIVILSIYLVKSKFMNSIERLAELYIYNILILMIWIRVWSLIIFQDCGNISLH